MPQQFIPFAVFVRFKCENGNEVSKLVYVKEGEELDNLLYKLNRTCNEMSGKYGVNMWVEDTHVVNQHAEPYSLS